MMILFVRCFADRLVSEFSHWTLQFQLNYYEYESKLARSLSFSPPPLLPLSWVQNKMRIKIKISRGGEKGAEVGWL